MSQNLIGGWDFASTSTAQNIKGIVYQGNGVPSANVSSPPNNGCLYVDVLTNQVWICYDYINNLWKPYHSNVKTVTVDTDVQEGDVIGLYGAGSWSASGNLSQSKANLAGFGSQVSGIIAGGTLDGSTALSISELFNGSSWFATGNLNQAKEGLNGLGTQNAGLVIGGNDEVNFLSNTELFNGSSWSSSGNAKVNTYTAGAFGTQSAGLVGGGFNDSGNVLSNTELFNGSTWSSSGNLIQSKRELSGFGSQNSGLVAGGHAQGAFTYLSNTELFNGSTWSSSGNISQSRSGLVGGGTQYAGFITAGENANINYLSNTELFNGSTWSSSGNISQSRYTPAGGGSPSSGFVGGGQNNISRVNTSEIHSQTVYRKLNFRNLGCATNFGIAHGLVNTSYTANLIQGSVPTFRVPGQAFFGISPFQGEDNYSSTKAYITSTANINNIIAPVSGICSLTCNTLSSGLCPDILIEVLNASNSNNNGLFPITSVTSSGSGVQISFKNPNGVLQSSAAGTVSAVYGDRLSLKTTSITVSGTSMTISFSLTENSGITATQFNRYVRVGQILYLPYSTNGANGSKFNYGAYLINSVGSGNVGVTAINPASQTESSVSFRAELLQQYFVSAITGANECHILGFNGQMRLPYNKFTDDFETGLI